MEIFKTDNTPEAASICEGLTTAAAVTDTAIQEPAEILTNDAPETISTDNAPEAHATRRDAHTATTSTS